MPLYIGDLLRDIPHLDAERAGAYLLLIMAYWVSGRPLPDDDEHLSTVARVPLNRWRKTLRRILAPFFQIDGGEWHHKRIDKELAKASRITNERSTSGVKGAAKRWQTDGKAMAKPMANGMARASQNDAQPQPPPQKEEAAALPREGLGIIRRFDDLAAATFGEHLRRAFPDGTDLVIADRWLAAGADMALCEAVFSALMGRMKARGQGPPKSLKYFDQAISDALATAKAPMPEGQVNGRKSGRLSATEGIYAGFALALGQHEPEDDCRADSNAAEPLLDSGHAGRAAPTPKRGLAG